MAVAGIIKVKGGRWRPKGKYLDKVARSMGNIKPIH